MNFKVSHSQIGLLISLAVIPGISLGLPAGIIASKYSIKKFVFSAGLVS